jgi:WD40 repeat protein
VAAVESAHDDDVNCVAWCPSDPTLFASASDDGAVKLWSVRPRATATAATAAP